MSRLWAIAQALLHTDDTFGISAEQPTKERSAESDAPPPANPLRPSASDASPQTTTYALLDTDTRDPLWVDMFVAHFIKRDDALVINGDASAINGDNSTINGDASAKRGAAVALSAAAAAMPNSHDEWEPESDDLLFFVRLPHPSNTTLPPIFVKRRTGAFVPALDDLIAWKETFFFNVIIQTMRFEMTVSVCNRSRRKKGDGGATMESDTSMLQQHRASSGLTTVKSISKHVYASPNRTRMDKRKSSQNELTYPILHFCIDDFEEAFNDGIKRYLCVELSTSVRRPQGDNVEPSQPLHVTLFQGAVPFSALHDVYQSKANTFSAGKAFNRLSRSFLAALSGAEGEEKTASEDRETRAGPGADDELCYILMRGPNGKGHAQVAVQANGSAAPSSSTSPTLASDTANFFRSLGSSIVQPAAVQQTSDSQQSVALKCHMTYINLPWHSIIRDYLGEVLMAVEEDRPAVASTTTME